MVRWALLSPENWTSNLFSHFQFILPTPVKQAQDARQRQRKKDKREKRIYFLAKKLSPCHKLKWSHPTIFATWWWKHRYFKLFDLAELILGQRLNSFKSFCLPICILRMISEKTNAILRIVSKNAQWLYNIENMDFNIL